MVCSFNNGECVVSWRLLDGCLDGCHISWGPLDACCWAQWKWSGQERRKQKRKLEKWLQTFKYHGTMWHTVVVPHFAIPYRLYTPSAHGGTNNTKTSNNSNEKRLATTKQAPTHRPQRHTHILSGPAQAICQPQGCPYCQNVARSLFPPDHGRVGQPAPGEPPRRWVIVHGRGAGASGRGALVPELGGPCPSSKAPGHFPGARCLRAPPIDCHPRNTSAICCPKNRPPPSARRHPRAAVVCTATRESGLPQDRPA